MPPAINLIGQRFGRLVVAARDTSRFGGPAYWICQCDCGRESVSVRASHLKRGQQSCGCLPVEILAKRATKHGHAKGGRESRTFKSWASMRARCSNPKEPSYPYYGARGIAVCKRWDSFESFLADMGERPAGMTLERVNTNGNYEPTNCAWATVKDQNCNKRDNIKIAFNGKVQTISKWAEELGLPDGALRHRLSKYGWSVKRALTTPKAPRKSRGERPQLQGKGFDRG